VEHAEVLFVINIICAVILPARNFYLRVMDVEPMQAPRAPWAKKDLIFNARVQIILPMYVNMVFVLPTPAVEAQRVQVPGREVMFVEDVPNFTPTHAAVLVVEEWSQ
jgi:hypothetical protein